ncbi:uncharacterized protein DUF600 [Haloactinopolyspora alba]|uniref:Uncharacterized protein DUF600 n=1 Tax=Haloactinopolyspora alba TaxID=648780 RepID=A0A2P8E6T8_9ACTN|nr:immunity protein YezG family protein [Haloactinopolyspora alba]PSL05185.1 uncharacterized protein DUF600 [Haloactinopolyspora alba]
MRTVTELRKSMYEPGKGTWYNATFTVDDTGKITADFDYDNPAARRHGQRQRARHRGGAYNELMLKDHTTYPRDPENLPDGRHARTGSSAWTEQRRAST